jgi:hypothetical protein
MTIHPLQLRSASWLLAFLLVLAAGCEFESEGLQETVEKLGGKLLPQENDTFIVDLSKTEIDGNGVARLASHADRIRGFYLNGTRYSDDDCRALARFPKLVHLALDSTRVTAAGIRELLPLDHLEGLAVSDCKGIDDAACQAIAKLPALHVLSLAGTSVGNKGLESLRDCSGLATLWLDNTAVTDQGLSPIGSLSNLKTLSIKRTKITSDGLVHLRTLRQLEHLELEATAVDDAGLANLRDLPNLRSLFLPAGIGDKGVHHLQGLTQLREIVLYDNHLTDAGMASFGKLHRLRSLDLSNPAPESRAHITAAGIRSLAACKALRTLSLMGTGIDDACVAELSSIGLPKLTRVFLGKSSLSDTCIPHLSKMTGLREIDLVETDMSAAGIELLRRALPDCKIKHLPRDAR